MSRLSGVTRREEGAGGRSHMTTHLLLLLRLDLPPPVVCSSHVLFAFADVTRQKTDLIHRWQVLRVCFSLFYPASIRHKTTSLRAALSPHQLVFKQRALFVLNSPQITWCSNFNSPLQLGQSDKVTQTILRDICQYQKLSNFGHCTNWLKSPLPSYLHCLDDVQRSNEFGKGKLPFHLS